MMWQNWTRFGGGAPVAVGRLPKKHTDHHLSLQDPREFGYFWDRVCVLTFLRGQSRGRRAKG